MERSPWMKDRKVLLAVTGGIAAYKAPSLVRTMIKAGCEVKVLLTAEAEKFVSPMVLSVLSGNRTWTQRDFLSDVHGWEIPHIRLAEWADIVVVAPATANAISGAANGEGSSLLGSTLLATEARVLFVPSMNQNMFDHPLTQKNMSTLHEAGYSLMEPDTGYLACGYEARGRMPDNDHILEEIWKTLCPYKELTDSTVLVTAGPTREFADPVRFISNPSTGKMGLAMARNAWYRGADVVLVLGPTGNALNTYGFRTISVTSAREMYEAVFSFLEESDYIVKSAAVSDYRPKKIEKNKIKKGQISSDFVLELESNPDIALEVGRKKRKDQLLIGFAAESQKLEEYASLKLKEKNMDYIAANDITSVEGGFASNTNMVRLIDRNGRIESFQGSKDYVSHCIWKTIINDRTGTVKL